MAGKKKPRKRKDLEQDLIVLSPTPETPEQIASAIMKSPPKKKWRYLKKRAQ